jgi:sugar phosphate isomerase/epimerase
MPVQQSDHTMNSVTRRRFLAASSTATAFAIAALAPRISAAPLPQRRFTLDLTPGSIGVSGDQFAIIKLAHTHGFESVQPDAGFLAKQDHAGLEKVTRTLAEAGLRWGAAGLPVEFRKGDDDFRRDLSALPGAATALKKVGATRVGTWLMPGHNELEYQVNFRQHTSRLGEIARVLADHGLRLGLEYVGTPSLRTRLKFPFVHRLAQARDLIAAIGVPGTGLVLDSWHWWTAGDSVEDLRRLTSRDVVAVDLNDAPAGIPLDQQQDGRRELPAATGVIGTHPPMSEEAICERLEISVAQHRNEFKKVRFFNHEWDNPAALQEIGTLTTADVKELTGGLFSMEVPVEINKLVFNYDQVIIVGPVFPHEVVGFSGGNKYLFPGVGGPKILNFFHWLGAVVTNPMIIGNKWTPVRKVVDRAGALVKVRKSCFCMVVAPDKSLVGLTFGSPEGAWDAASELSEQVHIIYKGQAIQDSALQDAADV